MKTIKIICPGIHPTELTKEFTAKVQNLLGKKTYLVLPTQEYAPYNAIAIMQWLKKHYSSPKQAPALSFISFSAGVVGSIGAANFWQLQGGNVSNFIAFDGWGMPLGGNFPIHCVSHDRFTHDTSVILSGETTGFYADPEVEHLELWRSPDTCQGWRTISPGFKVRCSLSEYLHFLLLADS